MEPLTPEQVRALPMGTRVRKVPPDLPACDEHIGEVSRFEIINSATESCHWYLRVKDLTGMVRQWGCECNMRRGGRKIWLCEQPKCIYCGGITEPYKEKGVCIECYRTQE